MAKEALPNVASVIRVDTVGTPTKPAMPTIHTVCPHCEKNVEFTVTSVTRSRPCSHCGKPVLLQVAAGTKRKALLVANTDEVSAEGEPGTNGAQDQTAPKVLEGDVRHRMLHDPEVQASMRQFKWGAVVVLVMIAFVAVLGHFDTWNAISDFFTAAGKKSKVTNVPDFASPGATSTKQKVVLPQGPTAGREEPRVPVTSEANLGAALKIAQAFLNAKTADERFATIRDQKRLHDSFFKYYETHPAGPIEFDRIAPNPASADGSMTFTLPVTMPDGSKRQMTVGKARSGGFLVDWASFIAYGDMDLSDFKARRPTQPMLFRMLGQTEKFYGGTFGDARGLLCVKLTDPRDEKGAFLYGYVDRTSTLGRSLDFVLGKSLGQAVQIIVTLRYPDNAAADNQVWIEELITEGWLTSGR